MEYKFFFLFSSLRLNYDSLWILVPLSVRRRYLRSMEVPLGYKSSLRSFYLLTPFELWGFAP